MWLRLIGLLRSKIAIASALVVLVVAAITAACQLSKDAQDKLADRIKVADSFDLVDVHHDGHALVQVYVGPPDTGPADMIVSPRLSFSNLRGGDRKLYIYLGTAWADRTDGKDCNVDVEKLRPGVDEIMYGDLSKDQKASVIAGKSAVYYLTIICTP